MFYDARYPHVARPATAPVRSSLTIAVEARQKRATLVGAEASLLGRLSMSSQASTESLAMLSLSQSSHALRASRQSMTWSGSNAHESFVNLQRYKFGSWASPEDAP